MKLQCLTEEIIYMINVKYINRSNVHEKVKAYNILYIYLYLIIFMELNELYIFINIYSKKIL